MGAFSSDSAACPKSSPKEDQCKGGTNRKRKECKYLPHRMTADCDRKPDQQAIERREGAGCEEEPEDKSE
jgi:hypothetical protein